MTDEADTTCGLGPFGRRVLSYGPREFVVTPTPDGRALVRAVVDGVEADRATTTLPAPRKDDDPELVSAARAALAETKSALRALVRTESKRLRRAMGAQVRWTREDHHREFCSMPLPTLLTSGLVWSLHAPFTDQLVATCRLDEDLAPVDVDDEPVPLTGADGVELFWGLAHPVDLDPALVRAWQQVLTDYELRPLFTQLDLPIGRLPADQGDDVELHDLPTTWVHPAKFDNVLAVWGWRATGTKRHLLPWRWSNQTALLEDDGSPTLTRVVLLEGIHEKTPRKPTLLPWSSAPAHLVHDVVSTVEALRD